MMMMVGMKWKLFFGEEKQFLRRPNEIFIRQSKNTFPVTAQSIAI